MWMMRLTAAAGLVLALASCGDNQSPYEPWILDTLTPAEGLWIRTPEFDVAPGAEIQYCYFFQVPAQTDGTLWVDRVELAHRRSIRCSIAASVTRKAFAIWATDSPETMRRASAICCVVGSSGWQHTNRRRRMSSR